MLRAYAEDPQAFTATVPEREALPLAWWVARVSVSPEPDQLVIGARDSGRLVGVAGLRFHRREQMNHKASLFGISVVPDLRGQGVARALVEAVLKEARTTSGVRVVQLGFIEPNAPALRLYESCGFVEFGREPCAVRVGDQYRPIVHMWKEVVHRAA